jgi:hypothetical protein
VVLLAAVAVPAGPWRERVARSRTFGKIAAAVGTVLRVSRTPARAVPSLAGFAMISLCAAMVYLPAGIGAGGVCLLLLGREINKAP